MKNLFLVLLLVCSGVAEAKDVPVQGRIFVGGTQTDPKDLNTELQAQGLKEADTVTQFGAEVLFPVFRYLDVGIRYAKRTITLVEETSNPLTDYQAEINQDSGLAIVRIPFIKTSILRADAFGGFGGSNTIYKIKTASQDGQLTKKGSSGWFGSPYSAFGASVSVGWKKVYFTVEGGMETNKADDFKRTGTINNNVEAIDLSGSYVTIGVLFDGIEAKK